MRKSENPHGTTQRYKTERCRCQFCRKANTAYMKAYFAANPDQLQKNKERTAVERGLIVRITGPGKPLYWPGLRAKVPQAHRRLVTRELAQAATLGRRHPGGAAESADSTCAS